MGCRLEVGSWGVGGGGRDELVGGLTERTVRTEGNSLETDVKAFVLDDVAGASIFSSGVRVGANDRCRHATRTRVLEIEWTKAQHDSAEGLQINTTGL